MKRSLLPILLAAGALLLPAAAAGADLVVCGPGPGAGQCEEPRGVAVDRSAGLLFVADNGNSRVDVFDANSGAFVRAFGWDVIPAGQPGDSGTGLEVCTAASTCQAASLGPGSGQFGHRLTGIAVDNDPASPAYHDVYVYDGVDGCTTCNKRVQRFHPNGDFVLMFGGKVNKTKVDEGAPAAQQNLCTAASGDTCQAGVSGTAPGYFNSELGWTQSIALGPGGVVYVGDSSTVEPPFETKGWLQRVQKFDPSGALIEALGPLEPAGGSTLVELAVDSSGDLYVLSNDGGLRKYDPAGNCLNCAEPFHGGITIALDAADNLFVANNGNGTTAVSAYDPAHNLRQVIYGDGTQQWSAVALAPYQSASGDIFEVELLEPPGYRGGGNQGLGRVLHVAFPPPGPVVSPDPEQTSAKPLGNTTATLNTKVNPEGKATTYHFEYLDDASYGAEGGFASPKTKTTPEEAVVPGTTPEFAPELFRLSAASKPVGCVDPAAEAELPESPCLVPSTEYHLRAVATNADVPPGEERIGPEVTFETKPPFEIRATWASAVGIDAAKLSAEVNPLNILAQGRFEYVEEATYLEDVKKVEDEGKTPEEVAEAGFDHAQSTGEVDFGSGEAPATRTVQLHSLSADTAYRFRVFVEDPFASEFGEEEGAFTTFPLPEGPNTKCPNQAFRTGASAPLPDCRAYEMVSPVDKEGGEIKVLGTAENISTAEILQGAAVVPAQGRGLTYSSYRSFGDAISTPYTSQYIASRHPLGDPEEGWRSHGISPPREGASFGGLVQDVQYKAFAEDLGWTWLRSDTEPPLEPNAIAGFPNLYRRDNASDTYEAICPVEPTDVAPGQYSPKAQGASADGETVVLRADSKLTADASDAKLAFSGGQPIPQLYACAGGELRLVSVLPPALGGEASDGSSAAGTGADPTHRHDNLHNAVSADGERVYWTDSGDGSGGQGGRIYLRERPFAEGAECGGPAAPCTVAVSEAAGAPGADKKAQFWTASPSGSVAIFSFTEGPLKDNLYEFDAGTETTSPIAEGVSGLAGFSEDASRLYFVSTKELAPGALAGKPNLYLHEAGGGLELVAAMPGGAVAIVRCGADQTSPFMRCTRATADGSRLAFISRDPLSGYDNRDAQSGERDSEVFLYEASAAGGEGELLCVSCNPSGGRPAGQSVEFYNGQFSPIAARIPAWEHSLYAPRALSADGRRLFFESFDALVPTDTNGTQDVYEWEEAGKGDCGKEDANHFESNGGCLSLISSGKSPRDVQFADASADGSDVFFKTAASLLPPDPGLIDLYDARVGGGFPQPTRQAECEGEACQSPPEAPNDPTPASAAFEGAGNVVETPPKPCAKGKVRRRGHCVKRHKKQPTRTHRRHRRAQQSTATGEGQGDGAPRLEPPRGTDPAQRLPGEQAQGALPNAGPAGAAFGLKEVGVEFTDPGGAPSLQAGSHPFANATTIELNTTLIPEGGDCEFEVCELPEGAVKDLTVALPAGFVGDPRAVPRCSMADFIKEAACPDATALGINALKYSFFPIPAGAEGGLRTPVFNLIPPPGVAARIGFAAQGVPVTVDFTINPDLPYNVIAHATKIAQAVFFYSSVLTVWGDPSSPVHDEERGECVEGGECPVAAIERRPFFTVPRSCTGPLETTFTALAWNTAQTDSKPALTEPGMVGCPALGFSPSISAQPTTLAAQSPTGLDFSLDVTDEGLTSPTGRADSDIKKAVVTLPEGFSTNPSIAEGLGVCTEAQLQAETAFSAPGEGCPKASKIGTVEVETPLLDENVNGSLYIAKPYENEFNSLLALYVVIKNPTVGIVVRQALKVEADPVTGQLTTVAEDLPQLPFSHFRLHFREGARSPLASPPACGAYDAKAELTPWSGGAPLTTTSAFQIISGPGGGPCPTGGVPPFKPGLVAGTLNNAAGHFSPFNVRLFRSDSEQEITHFSIKLPPGVVGKLAGIPFCPDSAIEAAKARTGPLGGQEELEAPSCPAASEIGRTLVGSGVGPALAYAPGKVYLSGPYHGSPLSLVAVTAGVVGPFDIGTVVVREALKINPETAEVFIDSTGSDPIPHIVKGIPVHLRDIRVYTDRPKFVLNPTDCTRTSTASTVLGSGLDFASEADDNPVVVSTPFQAADCAALPFAPRLKLSLLGGTRRGAHPKLKATLRMNGIGEAAIAHAQVTLPRSAFLDQSHIRTVCTRVQYAADQCPEGSIYGYAKAVTPLLDEPIEGPVFLRSSEHKLPDLVGELRNGEIEIDLVGRVDSLNGRIRNTFETVPDAPVSTFTLEMQGGRKGLLVNSTDLCKGRHRAIAEFTGHNGKVKDFRPVVGTRCPKARHRRHHRNARQGTGW